MFSKRRTGLTDARLWHLVDAKAKDLDITAARIGIHLHHHQFSSSKINNFIAIALKGSLKPLYIPTKDTGDFVVVINARHIMPETTNLIYKWSTG